MKVGIVGTGGMGGVHASAYAKMADVELHAFDRSPERLATFCERTSATPHDSLSGLIAAVQVLDICLPTDLHEAAALEAISAGKAVFCEKPLARTLESARTIIRAAESAGVCFGVGQVVRFFPDFKRAHDLVASGAVGKPAAVRTHRGGGSPTGADLWFMDHARSGGVLVDLAIHDFDWLRWTFGEVKNVFARSTGAETGAGPEYALTILTMVSGAIAHVESTWLDPSGFWTAVEVAGSEGLINYDSRSAASVRLDTAGKTAFEGNFVGTDDPYYQELRVFLDAVAQGTPAPVGGREGFAALAIALAALDSAKTGQPVAPEPF